MAAEKKAAASGFSFVGKDVTITYEQTSVLTVEATVLVQESGGVVIQYDSRGKRYTEFVPYSGMKGMSVAESLKGEKDAAESGTDE